MNYHAKNRKALADMTHEERLEALQDPGVSLQHAEDYLRFQFPPGREKWQVPRNENARIERIGSTAERMLANIRKNAPILSKQETLSQLERHILHNRFLLGAAAADLETASFQNLALKQTEVIRWFRHEFIPCNYRMGLLLGGTGEGKTFGALAYINQMANPEINNTGVCLRSDAVFITAYRISEMVTNYRKFQEDLDALRQKRLLVIDELGGEPAGFRGADFLAYFDNLMAERHKFTRTRTIITSNWTSSKIKEVYGQRFISRFNQVGIGKEFKDGDMREQRG